MLKTPKRKPVVRKMTLGEKIAIKQKRELVDFDDLRSLNREIVWVSKSAKKAKGILAKKGFEQELNLLRRRRKQLIENASGVPPNGKKFAAMKNYR